jgi:transposase InsO family protein
MGVDPDSRSAAFCGRLSSSTRSGVDHVELGTAEWVTWFNTERPHNELDDFTPETIEKLHYAHRNGLRQAG